MVLGGPGFECNVEELICQLSGSQISVSPFPDPHPGPSVASTPTKSLEAASVDENPPSPLLFNIPSHILRDIGNMLDVESLVRLALTCHDCYAFFHQPSAKTGISIPLTIDRFDQDRRHYHITFGGSFKMISLRNEEAVAFVEQLKRWPFRLHIDEFIIRWMHNWRQRQTGIFNLKFTRAVCETVALLHQLAPVKLRMFYAEESVAFEALREIIEKYRVEELVLNIDRRSFYSNKDIEYFLRQPFYELFLGWNVGSLDLVGSSEIPVLEVSACILSRKLLRQVIEKFLETEKLEVWTLNYLNIFISKTDLMAALEDSSNCRFSHSGPLPERRPLVFIPDNYEGVDPYGEFYILRDDGKLLYLKIGDGDDFEKMFEIKLVDTSSGPPVLAQ